MSDTKEASKGRKSLKDRLLSKGQLASKPFNDSMAQARAALEEITKSSAAPEPATSISVSPESVTPESVTPNPDTPESVTRETVTPNLVTPETATPKLATPETATPKTATPKAVTPETATPKRATPISATPTTVTPDLQNGYTENGVTKNGVTENTSVSPKTVPPAAPKLGSDNEEKVLLSPGFMVPKSLRISRSEILIFQHLLGCVSGFTCNQEISENTKIPRNTIDKAITKLKKLGYLAKEDGFSNGRQGYWFSVWEEAKKHLGRMPFRGVTENGVTENGVTEKPSYSSNKELLTTILEGDPELAFWRERGYRAHHALEDLANYRKESGRNFLDDDLILCLRYCAWDIEQGKRELTIPAEKYFWACVRKSGRYYQPNGYKSLDEQLAEEREEQARRKEEALRRINEAEAKIFAVEKEEAFIRFVENKDAPEYAELCETPAVAGALKGYGPNSPIFRTQLKAAFFKRYYGGAE